MKHRLFPAIIAGIALGSLLAMPLVSAEDITRGEAVALFTQQFKPGEYLWHPEISPAGPVVLVIILSEQVLHVYRNSVRIGSSTISSGKAGYRSPPGVFTILQKKVEHTSTIYTNMPMPYMQRLTWDDRQIRNCFSWRPPFEIEKSVELHEISHILKKPYA